MLHFWFNEKYDPELAVLDSSSNKMAAPGIENEKSEEIPILLRDENTFISSIYPNPNDGTMKMDYILPDNSKAKLFIYDLTGRVIETFLILGNGQLQINNNNLINGIYFYEVELDGTSLIKDKLIIIK